MEAWTPTPGQTWPPKDHGPLWKPLTVWEAWWTGQPDALRAAMTQASQVPANHPSQYRGGIVGAVARTFWGRPLNQADRPSRSDLHLPLAADIARTSADLLYADAPTITSQDERSQVVIDAMVDTGLIETLTEGAELGAALGGRYHRVTIDPTVDDGRPFITTHGPDEVIPTFTWGRLTAATIVETITDDDTTQIVWRHMEHHYLDPAGYGHIRHDLWKGTRDTLGTLVPLTDRPETAGLQVNADAEWTGPLTPGLAIAYIPNVTPNRAWRKHPIGRNLGRPDIDGLTPLLDALDEAWSSWMRDLRLGKARILASRNILETTSPDDPLTFDLDREVFVPLDTLDRGDDLPVKEIQFSIRVAEHQATVTALTNTIINQAGYSLGSFQETDDTDITATEVKAREKRTLTTRGRKVVRETRALRHLVVKALAMTGQGDVEVDVEFPNAVSENPLDQSAAVAQVKAAGVMSRAIAVRALHPDWDDAQVNEELAAIAADKRDEASLDDPTTWHPTHDENEDE